MRKHGRGQRRALLERAEEIEGQGLAGQQVGPETLDVDDGTDLAIRDLVLDEGDQGEVDQVDAGPADAVADAAAEAARAAVEVVLSCLAPFAVERAP
jgi:hypothetical protein